MSASDSGLMFGLMQLVSVPAGMILIAIGSRPRMLRPAFYLVSLTMVAGLVTLMVLPVDLAFIPAVLLGFGLGIFPLVMVMISRSGSTTSETTALSTLAQSTGYLLATAGPFGMGLLHSATGGWGLPLAILLGLAVVQVVVGHLITSAEEVGHGTDPLAAPAARRRGHRQAPRHGPFRRMAAAPPHPGRARADGRAGHFPRHPPGSGQGAGPQRHPRSAPRRRHLRPGHQRDARRRPPHVPGPHRQHILEVRVGLDTQAARLAARNATADDVTALRGLLADRDRAWQSGDVEAWALADWGFHERVALASGNPLLFELYASFGTVFHQDLLSQQRRPGFAGLPQEGHGVLLAAIERGDADAAVATVNRNLNTCAEWLAG